MMVVIVNDTELALAHIFAKGSNAVGVLRDDRVILSIDELFILARSTSATCINPHL
jgi:hypothetical protein